MPGMNVSVRCSCSRCDAAYLWYGSSLFPREICRLLNQRACLHCNILGISTSVGQAKDFISHRESIGGFCTDFDSDAGALYAQDGPGLRRHGVFSKALAEVHAVETERLDLHEDIAWSQNGCWDFVDEQRFGRALLALDICPNISDLKTLDCRARE
jgi:hypothetical protein